MALTVGELNAVLSVDDRAVDPGLRRAEDAIRASGQRMGDEAERAGQQAGEDLGDGIVRGADGRLRNARGRFVAAGRAAGNAVGEGLADGTAEGADEAVDQATSRMDRLKMAAAGVGLAAGAFLMSSFQEALNQSQITARLGAQLATTPAVAQQYGRVAGQLFKEAIVTDFQQGADAIKAVAGSGLLPPGATNAQIKSIASNAADLANAFEIDVSLAAQAAGSAVKNGLAKDGKAAFDLLAKGMQGLGPAGEDLAETFREYGPVLKTAGLSGQTALGLMRQAIQGGWAQDTDKIADAFKELNLRVTSGSKASQDALKGLGLDAKQVMDDMAAGGAKGEKAMDDVIDAMVEMGPETAGVKQAVQELFGGPGEDLGAALFAMDVSKASAAMGNAEGAADKLGTGLRDNAGAKVTAFKNTLQQNLIEFLGTEVIPKLEKVFGFIQEHSGVFIAAAAGVTALGAAFSLAALGVWAMNSAMLANPMFWIIAGIAAAVAGLVILIVLYWDDIKSATLAAWDWVVAKLVSAKNGILAAVDYLGTIPGKVSAWFGKAKDWAVQKMTQLRDWLTGLPGRIIGAISAMQSMLSSAASRYFQGMRDAAVKRALALVSWVRGLPGQISRGIGSLSSLLTSKGRNVVQGLWSGISSMGGWIKSRIMSWAKSVIPGPVAKALGIASPSKVTKAQGKWIARGLVEGLTGESKQVRAASYKLVDIVKDALTGKKERAALKRINKDAGWLDWLAKREAQVAARLKDTTKRLADLRKERDKLAADVRKNVLDDANITKQDSGGWTQTAETILAGLKQDTAAAITFAKNLATLRKKGVRSDLVAQIAQAGVTQGSSAAAALANANSGQVKQINHQQALLVNAAGQAGTTAGDAMYGAGIQAAAGLVRGLQSQQKTIENTMVKMAKGLSKAMRKALGIRSPSRVMAVIGQYTAQGLIKGVEGQRTAVNKSMASLVETPAPGSWDMAGARARADAARRVVLELRSSGRQADDFVMESMRRGVRKKGGGDVDLVIAGRRSG